MKYLLPYLCPWVPLGPSAIDDFSPSNAVLDKSLQCVPAGAHHLNFSLQQRNQVACFNLYHRPVMFSQTNTRPFLASFAFQKEH